MPPRQPWRLHWRWGAGPTATWRGPHRAPSPFLSFLPPPMSAPPTFRSRSQTFRSRPPGSRPAGGTCRRWWSRSTPSSPGAPEAGEIPLSDAAACLWPGGPECQANVRLFGQVCPVRTGDAVGVTLYLKLESDQAPTCSPANLAAQRDGLGHLVGCPSPGRPGDPKDAAVLAEHRPLLCSAGPRWMPWPLP